MDEKHLMIDGVMISVKPIDVIAVATELTVSGGNLWMEQLRFDRQSKRFYLAHGRPKVSLPVPGILTYASVELADDDMRCHVCTKRAAYHLASELGVTVETVNEATGERPPCLGEDD